MGKTSKRIFIPLAALVTFITILLDISAFGQTNVGGEITSDVTFSPDKNPYYVNEDITIFPGATLTLLPGVKLYFKDGRKIVSNGILISKGNADNQIEMMHYQNPAGKWKWEGLLLINATTRYDAEGNYLSGTVLSYTSIVNARIGITLDGGTAILIENSQILNSFFGITIGESAGNKIRNSKIVDCDYGIYFGSRKNGSNQVTGNTISCSQITGNTGIFINKKAGTSSRNTFSKNRIFGYSAGIQIGNEGLHGVSQNLIEYNDLYANSSAIRLYQDSTIVRGNRFTGNTYGMFCWKSSFDSIYDNTFKGNTQFAVVLTAGSSSNHFLRNTIERNEGGIYIKADAAGLSLNNSFIYNTIQNNSYYSFRIENTPQKPIQFNNIISNGRFRTFENAASGDILATENYWGTTREPAIDSIIYDKLDVGSRGEVIYKPFFDTLLSNSDVYYTLSGRIHAGSRLAPFSQVNLYQATAKNVLRKSIVSALGVFSFNAVLGGEYYLYVIPDKDYSPGYAPTYFYDEVAWENAENIKITADTYDVDVNLVKTLAGFPLGAGAGSISGYCASLKGVCADVTVMLCDKSLKNILDWKRVSNGGEFSFSNLPFGEYTLVGEKTGIPLFYSNVITLTPANATVPNVVLECAVAGYKFSVPVQPLQPEGNALVRIYPNPFTETLNFEGYLLQGSCLVRLTNSQGIVYNFPDFDLSSAKNALHLGVLPAGFFILELWSNGVCVLRQKVVKL